MSNISDPAIAAEVVVPHASNNFPGGMARALYVGGAGDITLVTYTGQVVTFSAVPAGTILPVQCSRVNAIGTTATLMVALK